MDGPSESRYRNTANDPEAVAGDSRAAAKDFNAAVTTALDAFNAATAAAAAETTAAYSHASCPPSPVIAEPKHDIKYRPSLDPKPISTFKSSTLPCPSLACADDASTTDDTTAADDATADQTRTWKQYDHGCTAPISSADPSAEANPRSVVDSTTTDASAIGADAADLISIGASIDKSPDALVASPLDAASVATTIYVHAHQY